MRIVSIILNIILLLIVVVIIADDGLPRKLGEQLMILVFIVAPIFSLIALWRFNSQSFSESWLSLFLQRKKLEEKAKLEKLQNQ